MPQDNTQTQSTQPVQPPQAAQLDQPVQPTEPGLPIDSNQAAQPIEPIPVSDVVVTPDSGPSPEASTTTDPGTDVRTEVAAKISESKNVLIALSGDPSVDELSAAIGLSLYLDKIGKRATAIYSGITPNTLEFLRPEETFESTADTLQDFVIAINKEKADHLRYKLDGDYVKVYITPYRHRISEEDLDFSYGDYNVDLVLALDVANGIDLDSALREHGRIMHDAVIVNITTGNPGKFGELEWSDKEASSVSEMITQFLIDYGGNNPIAKDEATAFLTGIVAATNRFSNAKTTPATMRLSSRLMEFGANQQLVSKNITPDTENELFGLGSKIDHLEQSESTDPSKEDPDVLDVEHEYETRNAAHQSADIKEEVNAEVTKKEHNLLDDLKAAEESLSQAGAETTPIDDGAALTIENGTAVKNEPEPAEPVSAPEPPALESPSPEPVLPEPTLPEPTLPEPTAPEPEISNEPAVPEESPVPEEPTTPDELPAPNDAEMPSELPVSNEPSAATEPTMPEVAPEAVMDDANPTPTDDDSSSSLSDKPEKVIAPSDDFDLNAADEEANKYGQMLQDALDSVPATPDPTDVTISSANPAAANTPSVPSTPEINGVPEMNFMPMPGTEILPPPPAPPIANLPQNPEPAPTAPTQPEPESPTPASPVQSQPDDPSAFRIPGM